MSEPGEVDYFSVAEDAYRYSEAVRAGQAPGGSISFDHRVIVRCDSATRPVRWYHLVAKHGRRKLRRCRCPECGKMATLELVQ